MGHQKAPSYEAVPTHRGLSRVAVIGAGISGLSCARELLVRGYEPVVFEASGRLGGRCSSHSTRIGWFDDGAQVISGPTRLAAYAAQRPGMLEARIAESLIARRWRTAPQARQKPHRPTYSEHAETASPRL